MPKIEAPSNSEGAHISSLKPVYIAEFVLALSS